MLIGVQTWLWLALIVCVAGITRGLTGFGAGIVMAPALALLFGGQEAVGLAITLNTMMVAQLFAPAAKIARWSVVIPMALATFAGIAIGVQFLVTIDPTVAKHVIGYVGIVFALIALVPIRWRGYSLPASSLIGAVTGLGVGVAGMGGTISVVYAFSGDVSASVKRAIVIVYTSLIQVMAFSSLVAYRVVTPKLLLTALVMLPFALASTHVGAKLFHRVDEKLFARLSVALIIVLSIVAAI